MAEPDPAPEADRAPASRVAVTPAATDLLARLRARHGPLMFHQSGGCCDGSSPMCYPEGEFRLGSSDRHLGDLNVPGVAEPVPVWMSGAQFEYWRHTHLTIDVVAGRGSGFSLEAPEGVRFLLRSRLLSDAELHELELREGEAGENGTPPRR
ncbi:DUF779 domain-containing protein [Actinoalloteichus spitiensis]|uniref:DUF779 domain-containing protein n=1 Tax=Actinoalloteichus spitiensis TaxID=252394 RepID=UPI00036FECF4|nr:DUF779 domain-containing protein [Actinoalloteichus spitiensis]